MPGKILVDTTPLRESRDFRLLFIGQLISMLGTQLTVVAIPYQVFTITHSSLQVGAISLAQLFPFIAGALVAGPLGDSLDRRRIMLFSTVALSLTSAALAVNASVSHPSLLAIYLVSSVAAAVNGFSNTARMASVPGLVERRHIPAAAAMMQITFQVGSVVGPALSGILLGIGLPLVYGIDAGTYVVAFIATAMMAPIPGVEGPGIGPWESIKEGMRFLRGHQALQGVYIIDINAMVFGMPRALFPAMAGAVFGGGTITLGLPLCRTRCGCPHRGVDHRVGGQPQAPGLGRDLRRRRLGCGHRRVRPGRHLVGRIAHARHRRLGGRDLGRAPQHDPADEHPRPVPQPDVLHTDGGRPGWPAPGRHGVGRRGHRHQHRVLGRVRWAGLHRGGGHHRPAHAAVPQPSRRPR